MNDTMSTSPATPPSAPEAQLQASRQRLDRLEGFLREDPSNTRLLVDAFDTALAAHAWERAHFLLAQGQAQHPADAGWRLREADFWMAQARLGEARAVLDALASAPNTPAGLQAVVTHNLALIDLQRGQYGDCVARLAPWMEAPPGPGPGRARAASAPDTERALQMLWLRGLHHLGETRRALAWALDAEQRRALDARAAGIASLIALDASAFDAARRWSSAAQDDADALPAEALVTQSTLALASRDADRALRFADAALQRHPRDGRAWSARAFALLLAGDLAAAREAFAQALAGMPAHIGTWHGQAWAELLAGDLAAAERSFQSALALDRNFAESHGGLAVVLAMRQRTQEAAIEIERARRLDPSNRAGRYADALLRGEIKEPADLQRFAQQMLAEEQMP